MNGHTRNERRRRRLYKKTNVSNIQDSQVKPQTFTYENPTVYRTNNTFGSPTGQRMSNSGFASPKTEERVPRSSLKNISFCPNPGPLRLGSSGPNGNKNYSSSQRMIGSVRTPEKKLNFNIYGSGKNFGQKSEAQIRQNMPKLYRKETKRVEKPQFVSNNQSHISETKSHQQPPIDFTEELRQEGEQVIQPVRGSVTARPSQRSYYEQSKVQQQAYPPYQAAPGQNLGSGGFSNPQNGYLFNSSNQGINQSQGFFQQAKQVASLPRNYNFTEFRPLPDLDSRISEVDEDLAPSEPVSNRNRDIRVKRKRRIEKIQKAAKEAALNTLEKIEEKSTQIVGIHNVVRERLTSSKQNKLSNSSISPRGKKNFRTKTSRSHKIASKKKDKASRVSNSQSFVKLKTVHETRKSRETSTRNFGSQKLIKKISTNSNKNSNFSFNDNTPDHQRTQEGAGYDGVGCDDRPDDEDGTHVLYSQENIDNTLSFNNPVNSNEVPVSVKRNPQIEKVIRGCGKSLIRCNSMQSGVSNYSDNNFSLYSLKKEITQSESLNFAKNQIKIAFPEGRSNEVDVVFGDNDDGLLGGKSKGLDAKTKREMEILIQASSYLDNQRSRDMSGKLGRSRLSRGSSMLVDSGSYGSISSERKGKILNDLKDSENEEAVGDNGSSLDPALTSGEKRGFKELGKIDESNEEDASESRKSIFSRNSPRKDKTAEVEKTGESKKARSMGIPRLNLNGTRNLLLDSKGRIDVKVKLGVLISLLLVMEFFKQFYMA